MILTSLEQFTAAVPTAISISNFDDIRPFVRSAEAWLKNEILGELLYTNISEDNTGSTDSTVYATDELVDLCVSVIANHAYWDAIPFLDLVHTDSGFAVISATNKLPASKERVERLREQCLLRRDAEADLLFAYLEAHIEYHDDWKGSTAYSILSDTLIQTATEMQLYSTWTGTRKEFKKLRPRLMLETMMYLEPVFSKAYIEELVELQRDGEIEGDNLKVITLLKYALGSLATDNLPAAEKVAADALRYIDANIEEFDTYTSSGEYAARIQTGYENETTATIFSSLF